MICSVCERQRNKENLPAGPVYSDHLIFVTHFPLLTSEPAHYGHIILELRRHITRPSEMTNEEAQSVGLWTKIISSFLEGEAGAEHVYIVRIGDKTPHLHFHFVPRYPGTPQEFWGPLLWQWTGSKKASAQEMIAFTERFKKRLQP
jgi:histidine triad (HIT) family protein